MTKLNLYGDGLLGPIKPTSKGIISDKFVILPFSVLNTREGFWQKRKKRWFGLGIKSEVGRDSPCIVNTISKYNYFAGRGSSDTSIFDPVTCELMYKWFCPINGQIIDPFAGGSVRGIIASLLGYNYWGCDLRQEQIDANIKQGQKIIINTNSQTKTYNHEELTPIENIDGIYVKRDDLCVIHGARGGKARTCYYLAKKAKKGLTTAGSRQSPQVKLVSIMAKAMNLPCTAHVPTGDISEGTIAESVALGAEIKQHRPGYNSVIIKRSKEYAEKYGYTEIPFGMECEEAVNQTRKQVKNIPKNIKRIVVPVGSGMSLAGILHGIKDAKLNIEVIGILVGANPVKRLNKFAPLFWKKMVTFIESGIKYETHIKAKLGDIDLDPIYEAKCLKYLMPDDLFWIVGHRDEIKNNTTNQPEWICGDSLLEIKKAPHADFIFSCPPYGNLEKYSDDPRDISNMDHENFIISYRKIISESYKRLKNNRFACFVVGDFRDNNGFYRNFVSDTISSFINCGFKLYNEIILITAIGSLPIRITRQFKAARKIGKTHQNVLVFIKGDPKKATKEITK